MMLSSVAERVYWMSRYLERAQNTARLINVHTSLLLDLPKVKEINWYTLIRIFDGDPLYQKIYKNYSELNIMQFMMTDRENPSSLLSTIFALRENVRTSLDLLPEEIWEQVNQQYMLLQDAQKTVGNRHMRQAALRKIINGCQRIRGILDCHMSRDSAFDFIQVGKHIERADMNSRVLEMASVLLSETRSDLLRRHEGILWTNLLESLGARQMYQKHMKPRVQGRDVLQFLMHDSRFPRSIEYSLHDIGVYLRQLPDHGKIVDRCEAVEQQHQATSEVEIPVEEIQQFMDQTQYELGQLHGLIADQWFNPAVAGATQSQSQSQGTQSQSSQSNNSTE